MVNIKELLRSTTEEEWLEGIWKFMRTYKITQKQIAEKLGYSPSWMSNILSGKVPFRPAIKHQIEHEIQDMISDMERRAMPQAQTDSLNSDTEQAITQSKVAEVLFTKTNMYRTMAELDFVTAPIDSIIAAQVFMVLFTIIEEAGIEDDYNEWKTNINNEELEGA